ncbi:hypothetical protein Trco_002723 [Trichoderma cornu-damae]|uniref:Anaphase-promoting complex, subunit CDC26 n=1 Tax=Trichoderma cornu-damae TaxID=654480 RepID=A0A9P8QVF1_9HYPO|nr:hypothetical protein Trco_002723 [Trichoderma cornu-damae]
MLRRPPTTLQITAEDIAAYEDRRAGEALVAAQQVRAAEVAARAAATGGEAAMQQQAGAATGDFGGAGQAMEGVQEGVEARARRAREERSQRIGVGRRAR